MNVVHLDPVYAKFVGQGHRSKITTVAKIHRKKIVSAMPAYYKTRQTQT